MEPWTSCAEVPWDAWVDVPTKSELEGLLWSEEDYPRNVTVRSLRSTKGGRERMRMRSRQRIQRWTGRRHGSKAERPAP